MPSVEPAPDEYFDREWALLVLDRALKALTADMVAAGKGESFDIF